VYVERAIRTGKDPARVVKFYGRALTLSRHLRKDTEAALTIETLTRPPYESRPDARVVVVKHMLATRDYPGAREHATADGLEQIAVWNAAMLDPADMTEAFAALRDQRRPSYADLPADPAD
jgi:hypothetical protein